MKTTRVVVSICFAVLIVASAFAQNVTAPAPSGTVNAVPKFSGTTTVVNSAITENGGNVGIGTTTPSNKLAVVTSGQIGDGARVLDSSTGSGILLLANSPWGYSNPMVQPGDQVLMFTGNGVGSGNLVIAPWSASNNTGIRITSNGNVGIGTTSPVTTLDVGGYLHAWGNSNPATTGQGAYLGWNALTGGTGETDFINNQGGGPGGFAFMNTPSGGSPKTTLMFLNGTGNLGIGTNAPAAKLEVNGNMKLTAGSGASLTFADGTTQTTAFTGVLCGGDYAESVDVSGDRKQYEPGDVLAIDDTNPSNFIRIAEPYSTAVAGIYSTKPGVVGRRQTAEKSPVEIPMAMVGIVPVKVSAENGPIRPHDLLVSSSTPGYAMKGTDRSLLTGAVIGKAMGSLDSGTGVIEVLVTLQ